MVKIKFPLQTLTNHLRAYITHWKSQILQIDILNTFVKSTCMNKKF